MGKYRSTFTSSWGGEAVEGDDGNWHVFAAAFDEDSGLTEWLTKSRVLHGISTRGPQGPYVPTDVALGPRDAAMYWDGTTQHNPAVQRDATTGQYLLFYMGSTTNQTEVDTSPGCAVFCSSHHLNTTTCSQRVGLATANDPNGPWARLDRPILDVGPRGAWDDQFTTNPTPHVFANGSALLIYKARSRTNMDVMSTGVAFAKHWAGPYERVGNRPIDVSGNCEDAGVYFSTEMAVYRIILHCGCNYQSVWSVDGLHWNRTAAPQPWCSVEYTDGTREQMARRERPKWVVDKKGRLVALLSGVVPTQSHGGQSFTLAQTVS